MTQHQQENVAKYMYDLSKVLFATTVVGNLLAKERFNMVIFFIGTIGGLVFFFWGFWLDGLKGR